MKKHFFALAMLFAFAAEGQVYRDRIGFELESIADIDIGWRKMYKFSTPAKGKQLGHRTYSGNQIGYSQKFIEWMQESYLPKGCLGDAGYYQNYIPKFSNTNSRLGNAINTHANALPHLYGAFTKMYMFLKKDAAGNFVPQNNFAEYWNIEANGLQHISKPVSFISGEDEYYFVLPDFRSHAKGYDEQDKAAANMLNFDTHTNTRQHRHFYIPPKIIGDSPQFVVILSKDNSLPFEGISVGEFFALVEKQFPAWQNIDPVSSESYATAQKNLARLKEKYKSKWNEMARLELSNTDINLQTFVNSTVDHDDFFDHTGIVGKEGSSPTFPVQRLKKGTRELSKTGGPQWVVIRWTTGMPNKAFNVHLHESILNNFNFDFVHDYFFNPANVKGQVYKPLRSPANKEPDKPIKQSDAAVKAKADHNTIFFDDFSATPAGKKPVDWQSSLVNGATALVTRPAGLEGNWVELTGHTIQTSLKKPVPDQFSFSYDLVASQHFTWGAKGLTMKLAQSTTGSFVLLKLRPGFDGRDGEATLETKFVNSPGYLDGTKYYKAVGFSNDKTVNLGSVMIKKKGEMLQVFINSTKIAEFEKAIPSNQQFNTLSFDCSGNQGGSDKYWIGNVRLVKE